MLFFGRGSCFLPFLSFPFFLSFFQDCTCKAYGSSQTRRRIGAAAAGPCHSYSNARSEPYLWPTYAAACGNARSLTHEQGQGSNPHSHGYQLAFNPLSHKRNSFFFFFFNGMCLMFCSDDYRTWKICCCYWCITYCYWSFCKICIIYL